MSELLPPDQRLRAIALVRPTHVVLVQPEIPPNTGNIARLCAATGCALHLVKPLGFRIDEHAVRRAGLDYWPLVELYVHDDLDAAEAMVATLSLSDHGRHSQSWLFSGRAQRNLYDVHLRLGDALIFGKESVGLDETLLETRAPNTVAIPTCGPVRSLNLSNSVAIAVYESLRQNALMTTCSAGLARQF
jgi:tRNA (cytidine/uridine-2'-O-)-methyltransferase